MLSYKEFKKGYLNEWVDRSQAARKAAEELAKKEVKPSLRDTYVLPTADNPDLVFTLDGHKVEFKGENEKNPKDKKYDFFTYDEAIKCFGEPDLKDGWRLPTKEELEALCHYSFKFDEDSKQGVIDKRLYLPAMGIRTCDGNVYCVGSDGYYWSSTPDGLDRAWRLCFYSGTVGMYCNYRCCGQSVRLVRDVK